MSEFKTADARTREKETQQRTQRGLAYLNPDFAFKQFSAVDGENSFRIVPPLAEDKEASLWGLDVWVYYLGNKAYLAPTTFNKSAHDPVLEMYNSLKQTDAEAAKAFKGTKRSLTFVLDLNTAEEELKLWPAPSTVIDEILKISKNRRTGELVAVEDPNDGRVIFFSKTGTGVNTRYSGFQLDQQAMPLPAGLGAQMVTFKELLIVPSSEELKQVIADMKDTGEGGADAARPSARTRRPTEDAGAAQDPAPQQQPVAQQPAPVTQQAVQAANQSTQPVASPSPQNATASGDNSADDLKARVEARIAARKKAAGAG